MSSQLLTLAAAAKRLGYECTRSVKRLRDAGELQILYPKPRTPRILESNLEAYINRLREKAELAAYGRKVSP